MPDPTTTQDLLAQLAKLKPTPHHLTVAVADDDEPRTIPIANVRKRWQRIAPILEGLDWTEVIACDKAGGILAHYRAADDAPDAGAEIGVDAAAGGVTIRETQLAQLLVQAVQLGARVATDAAEKAVARHAATFRALGDGMRAQLDALTQGSRIAVQQYQQALVVQREVLMAARGPDDEGGDQGEHGIAALGPLIDAVVRHAKPGTNGKAPHKPTKKPAQ